ETSPLTARRATGQHFASGSLATQPEHEPTDRHQEEELEMSEPSTTARIKGLRIIAVDDEPDILETIVDVLDGATVDRAKSYQEAIELLVPDESKGPAGEKYDVAVLDIMGVDGMSLLAETVNQRIPT